MAIRCWCHSNAYAIAPAIYRQLPYDPALDFAGVAALGAWAAYSSYRRQMGTKAWPMSSRAAKAKPGALNFSSVGVGSATRLSGERFRLSAGIDVVHVLFKGGAEAMAEVIARRIDFFIGPVGGCYPLSVTAGWCRLAVNATERARALPQRATMRQAGLYRCRVFPYWLGLFEPVKTPSHIVTRLP